MALCLLVFRPGPADLVLCYLTVYISELLRLLGKDKDVKQAQKNVTVASMSGNFSVPGDKNFPLAGFFSVPADRRDAGMLVFPCVCVFVLLVFTCLVILLSNLSADQFRQYYRQLREECANRLLDKIIYQADGSVPCSLLSVFAPVVVVVVALQFALVFLFVCLVYCLVIHQNAKQVVVPIPKAQVHEHQQHLNA